MGDRAIFVDDSNETRLSGELVYPGATVDDVLTVQSDGSIAAAAGGGSMPAWIQSGEGSPIDENVTPSQQGAVYFDLAAGGVWVAVGPTNADWWIVGGYGGGYNESAMLGLWAGEGPQVIAGPPPGYVDPQLGTPENGGVIISDAAAFGGSGNGLYYRCPYDGVDGDQTFDIDLGAVGEAKVWSFAADGSTVFPAGQIKSVADGTDPQDVATVAQLPNVPTVPVAAFVDPATATAGEVAQALIDCGLMAAS